MNASGAHTSFVMMPAGEGEQTKSYNDIINRRMKNRERQRRYRARKRLQADIRKPSILSQSTSPEVEHHSEVVTNYVSRVYCKRDWKKDARNAHIVMDQEDNSNLSVAPTLNLTSENLTPSSGFKLDQHLSRESLTGSFLGMVSNDTNRNKLGRRNWKADARKKNNGVAKSTF